MIWVFYLLVIFKKLIFELLLYNPVGLQVPQGQNQSFHNSRPKTMPGTRTQSSATFCAVVRGPHVSFKIDSIFVGRVFTLL